jgi:hypothetical protein
MLMARLHRPDYRLNTAEVPVPYYTAAEWGDLRNPAPCFDERRHVRKCLGARHMQMAHTVAQLTGSHIQHVYKSRGLPSAPFPCQGCIDSCIHLELQRAQQPGGGFKKTNAGNPCSLLSACIVLFVRRTIGQHQPPVPPVCP